MADWTGIGVAVGGVLSGIAAGYKFRDRSHKQRELHSDAEAGTESSRHIVARAEARLKEMHELRDGLQKDIGLFSLRLLAVEKDVQRLEGSLTTCTASMSHQYEELKLDMKEGKRTLDAILARVYAIPGGRRRVDDDDPAGA